MTESTPPANGDSQAPARPRRQCGPPRRRRQACRPIAAPPLPASTTGRRSARCSCSVLMIAVFLIGNPDVFSQWNIYRAVLIGLPVVLFVVVPLVFVVTVGEIDLSFPATIGMSGWVFALVVQAGYDPFLGMIAAVLHRPVPRLLRRLARRLRQPLLADRHARHELHAARPHPDQHRGQVDRAA